MDYTTQAIEQAKRIAAELVAKLEALNAATVTLHEVRELNAKLGAVAGFAEVICETPGQKRVRANLPAKGDDSRTAAEQSERWILSLYEMGEVSLADIAAVAGQEYANDIDALAKYYEAKAAEKRKGGK